MNRFGIFVLCPFLVCTGQTLNASAMRVSAPDSSGIIYLIPGQGSDHRIFKGLKLDDRFEIRHIAYPVPQRNMTMSEYARMLSEQIDTAGSYVLVGVSLGGMIATEMAEFLEPERVILISSAKCRDELPGRYAIQRWIPVYRLIPGEYIKLGARILQPLVEPDRNLDKHTFRQMLKDKDPRFMKRSVRMILEWDRTGYRSDIVHIHGENDQTLPPKNIKTDYLVNDGSHLMVLTKAGEISRLLNKIIGADTRDE